MLKSRQLVLLFGDIVALVLSFFIMTVIRFDIASQQTLIVAQAQFFAILFILWLIVFFVFELYSFRRINPSPRTIGFLALAITVSAVFSIIAFYLFPGGGISPKTNLLLVSIISFIILVGWRRIFYQFFAQAFRQRIAVIGTSLLTHALIKEIQKHPHIGTIVATWETIPTGDLPTIDLLITESVSPYTLALISKETKATVISLSQAHEELFARIPLALMTEEKALSIITENHLAGEYMFSRLLEIIVASIVLTITSPLLFLALIAIAIEDGKPFFIKQKRVGMNEKIFTIYKLRSMRALAPDGSAETNGVQWADQQDPRITKVGNILRKTHIDEIPQMINILKGDLALVGPRPERPELTTTLEKEIPYYFLRHTIRPGFTGWAQIKFRYARTILDSQDKFEYDLYYLKNRGLMLDFGIIVKTVQIIFTH